jgi:uncharacterized protein DUF2505
VKHLDLRHELACSPETYWDCVLDPEYNHQLFIGVLRFERYDVTLQRDLGDHVQRQVRAEASRVGVPGFLQKALPYIEEGDLDRNRSLYSFRTINESMGERVKIHGYMHCAELGPHRCLRTTEIHIQVTMLGVGGFVENRLEHDLKKSYDVSADFTNRWVR